MSIFSAQHDIVDATRQLEFEIKRAHALERLINPGEHATGGCLLKSRVVQQTADSALKNVRDIIEKVRSLLPKEGNQRSQSMVGFVGYSFRKEETTREINHLRQSIDSLYLMCSSFNSERLLHDLSYDARYAKNEMRELRNDVTWIKPVVAAGFHGQSNNSNQLYSSKLLAADRSFRTEGSFIETATEHSSVGDIWSGPILCRLYGSSVEGLEWIKKILDSTEIADLIERFQVWGTGLFEGRLNLDRLMDYEGLCADFLIGCFARICLNIEIILITLESRDRDVLSYLKELSLLLEGGDECVTIPTIILSKIDSDVNITTKEKLMKYFDNIEDDLDLLYEMLPAIYKSHHRQGNEVGDEDAVDESTLLHLVDEDIDLAKTLSESLKIHGNTQPAKFEKSPMEATVKLFEAEIKALHKWRNEKKERITNEMANILSRQAEVFRATDNAALDEMDVKDVRSLVETFQINNRVLQRLSADGETSAKDSETEFGFKTEKWDPMQEKLSAKVNRAVSL